MAKQEVFYQKSLEYFKDHNFIAPKDRKEFAEHLLGECKRFRITTPFIPLENLDKEYTDYRFGTEQEGNWTLRYYGDKRKKYNYVNGNMHEMTRLENDLATRQALSYPNEKQLESERKHARVQHFLAANITIIDEILTNNQKRKEFREPLWFIEVNLPQSNNKKVKGNQVRADVIMVGSDNRSRVLEIGNSVEKPQKVMAQANGLRVLYKQLNQSEIQEKRVIPYVVQYGFNRSEDCDFISIYHPNRLYPVISNGVKKIKETNPDSEPVYAYFAAAREWSS